MSDADTIRRLRAELDEAHETIRQLRERLAEKADLPWWAPEGMTPCEEILLRVLMARELVTPEAFDAALPTSVLKGGENDHMRLMVYVCRLRKHLRGTGVKIKNVWSRGYRLDRSTVPAHPSAAIGAAA